MGQTIFISIVVIWLFLILYKAAKAGKLNFKEDIEDDILHSIAEKNPQWYEDAYRLADFRIKKAQYMISEQWAEKRRQKLQEKDHMCELCSTPEQLQIHHIRGYNKIPYEPLQDLVVLCDTCHTLEHLHHGFPNSYEEYMEWDHPLER
jgi:hypothetical protein